MAKVWIEFEDSPNGKETNVKICGDGMDEIEDGQEMTPEHMASLSRAQRMATLVMTGMKECYDELSRAVLCYEKSNN